VYIQHGVRQRKLQRMKKKVAHDLEVLSYILERKRRMVVKYTRHE
jgi:hypothetical protein